MGTDMVSPAAAVSREVVSRERVSRKEGGDAFAALLQEITMSRTTRQGEVTRGMAVTPPEAGKGKAAADLDKDLHGSLDENLEETVEQAPLQETAIALLDRLYSELEEKGTTPLVLLPWLPEALFAGEGNMAMELQGLIQEMLPGRGDELGSLPAEEHFLLEQRLISGEIPLFDEKGLLTPEAGSVFSAYLEEAKVAEKFRLFFPEFGFKEISGDLLPIPADGSANVNTAGIISAQEVEGKLAGISPVGGGGKVPHGLSSAGMDAKDSEELVQLPFSREAAGQKVDPPALLQRLEGFLRSLLSGGRSPQGEKPLEGGLGEPHLAEIDPGGEGTPGTSDNPAMGGAFVISPGNNSEETAVARQASPFNHVQPWDIASQIAEKLTLLTRPGEQELRMKLQPEFLGEILIRMKRIRGVLTAEIFTQNIAVKELLESQMDALRQRFQQMEMHVEKFHVFLEGEKNGEGGGGTDRQPGGGVPGSSITKGAYGHEKMIVSGGYGENGRVNYLA